MINVIKKINRSTALIIM